jgi:hypothetical protein
MPFLVGWRLIASPGYMNKHATIVGAQEGFYMDFKNLQILEIDCSSRLSLTSGKDNRMEKENLELLKVCSIGSHISGLGTQASLAYSCDKAFKKD